MPKKILIVEDDKDIVEVLVYNLHKEGYVVSHVANGNDVFPAVKKDKPDLILLDLMLPGISGLDVCKLLKKDESTEDIFLIMLTAKSQEADKVVGLELGADDYMTKPFSPLELLARIKAVLRRQKKGSEGHRIVDGDLSIDLKKHKVKVKDQVVSLTNTEFKLLSFLARRPGMVFSRDQILNEVFGYHSTIYDRTVDTHIKSLRKKLGELNDDIETVRGVGYRFKEIS